MKYKIKGKNIESVEDLITEASNNMAFNIDRNIIEYPFDGYVEERNSIKDFGIIDENSGIIFKNEKPWYVPKFIWKKIVRYFRVRIKYIKVEKTTNQ